MNIGEYTYSIITIFISIWAYDWYYSKISYKRLNVTIEKNLVFLLTAILAIILESKGSFIVKQVVTITMYFIPIGFYKFNIKHKIFYVISNFITWMIIDQISYTLFTTAITLLKDNAFLTINVSESIFFYVIMTYIILLLYIITFNIKYYINSLNKIKISIFNNIKLYILLIIWIVLIYILISYDLFNIITGSTRVVILISVLLYSIITLEVMFYYCKSKRDNEYINNLLDNIDGNKNNINNFRIEKHNINQFLISLKGNNKEDINNMIDEYVKTNNKNINISTLNIPYNISGFLTNKMKQYNCKYYFNGEEKLENIRLDNPRLYNEVCSAIGISIDNAYDAIKNKRNKEIFIDISNNKNKTIITICNTFDNSININSLGNLFYTTKDNGNGIGLFTINNSKYVKCNISIINNLFKIILII